MSNLNFLHSGGNKVTLSAPDSNPSSDVTLKLPQADGSSGQFLKTNGSGALSFATPTDTQGVTMVDQYFLSVQKTANGNAAIALNTDFVRVSGTIPGAGHIGTGMTKNGEIFSFPSTGIYSIHFRACVMINNSSNGQRYAQNPIFVTTNNSTYNNVAMGLDGVENISGESFGNPIANFIFDVTNTSTHKCKFNIQSGENAWTAYVRTNRLDNVVTFTRLGDT
tara:strand:+ start:1396 stop:2061 length:666 start_codon:yes stop_codon:yes gene_type:complete